VVSVSVKRAEECWNESHTINSVSGWLSGELGFALTRDEDRNTRTMSIDTTGMPERPRRWSGSTIWRGCWRGGRRNLVSDFETPRDRPELFLQVRS
jgi:hypothetical protein